MINSQFSAYGSGLTSTFYLFVIIRLSYNKFSYDNEKDLELAL